MEKILKLDLKNLEDARRILVIIGILLLTVSVVFLVGSLLGLVSMESLAVGQQSGLRTLAGVAVVGCLLAAIGYWDQ